MEETENVSRTGRQRKKSAKVLEMEAEAEELEEVLKARVDSSHPKGMTGAALKAAKAKAQAKRALLKAKGEGKPDELPAPPQLGSEVPQTEGPALVETVSKSGRVRKKSAKLLEMVEVEELDRKIFRSSDIPKSMRTPAAAVSSPPSTPAKKMKLQSPTNRPPSVVSIPSGSTVTSQGGSTIQLLLTSPVKKSPGGPGSPPPEPILLTLGASLNSPSKIQHGLSAISSGTVLSQGMTVSAPVLTAAVAAPVQSPTGSPPGILKKAAAGAGAVSADGKPKEFEVKFLADCPDVVLPPKPVKRKSKKQANPTPSAPALPVDVTKTTPPPKITTAKAKKSPTAAVMADQPLLSKMMGEVGHAPIGPPPPSSAEAKSMKKKALKQAKEAAKLAETMSLSPTQILTEIAKKKLKEQHLEKKVVPTMPVLQPIKTEIAGTSFGDDDDDECEADNLMIDTSLAKPPKKKVKKEKKEKSPKSSKPSKTKLKEQALQARIQSELILKQELERAAADDSQSQEDDMSQEEEEEEDFEGMPDSMAELPSYANTNEMANKVQTSSEKKASKEKKKKKSGNSSKDDSEKQKKKRGPTAYMLYCNAQRAKLVTDNPGIDFATISRRLGEMWQGQTEKDKMAWKKKAKKLASKGSTVINTGKGSSKMLRGGASTAGGGSKSSPASTIAGTSSAAAKSVSQLLAKSQSSAGPSRSASEPEPGPSHAKPLPGVTPLDVAAHLKLLGESLSIIGARLQEHHGQIAVQGTLPVLLDSLLCALGPLTCLTSNIEELNGAPLDTHTGTLDNIAYIMPGIG